MESTAEVQKQNARDQLRREIIEHANWVNHTIEQSRVNADRHMRNIVSILGSGLCDPMDSLTTVRRL